MSNTLEISYVDTATSPVTGTRNVVAAPINYAKDWRVLKDEPGEAILTNITADSDRPEQIRFAVSPIADIFKGAPIEAPLNPVGAAYTKQGTSVLIQSTGCGEDGVSGIVYPYSFHLVGKLPKGVILPTDLVMTMIGRLLGHLYETGVIDPTTRWDSLIRGSMIPLGL